MADPSPRDHALASKILWLAIGLSPVLLGLLTWNSGSGRTPFQNLILLTGFPVAGVELLAIILAMRRGFEPIKAIQDFPKLAQSALVVLILIAFSDAFFVAPDGAMSAVRSCMALIHLMFALGVAHLVSATTEWRTNSIWAFIVGGVGAYILLLAIFIALIPHPDTFNWLHLGLGVMNIRHVGYFTAVGTAAALGLASGAVISRPYLASLAAASAMFGVSFWSGSRGPIADVLAAFVVGLILIPQFRSWRALLAVVASVPAGALLSLLHTVPDHHYGIARLTVAAGQSTVGAAGSGRLELWAGTWQAILRRPLFGYGEGQLIFVVPEALRAFHHPHNVFLQILFQWGLIGAVCMSVLGFLVASHCFRQVRTAGLLLICPTLVVATLLIMSLHDGTLFFGYPMMVVALCLGMLTSARPPMRDGEELLQGMIPTTRIERASD